MHPGNNAYSSQRLTRPCHLEQILEGHKGYTFPETLCTVLDLISFVSGPTRVTVFTHMRSTNTFCAIIYRLFSINKQLSNHLQMIEVIVPFDSVPVVVFEIRVVVFLYMQVPSKHFTIMVQKYFFKKILHKFRKKLDNIERFARFLNINVF